MKLDGIDLKILDILQERGRVTNAQLATEVGLSPAPTMERVRKLEGHGFIQSFHALLDAQKLGLKVMVFLVVKLDFKSGIGLDAFMQSLHDFPEITEAYLITGEGDFLLKLYAQSIEDFQNFLRNRLSRLNGIASIESKVVLSTIKKQVNLPIPEELLNGEGGVRV